MAEIIIALDAMGGDNAPDAMCEGALQALAQYDDIRIRLYGPEKLLGEKLAAASPEARARLDIVDCAEVISMEDAPMLAVRHKKDSSMVRAAEDVRSGAAHAFVSAGSTGAIVACGMMRVGRIPGVDRPALAVAYPGKEKTFLLLDSGAIVDCRPEWIAAFGLMGAAYMRAVFGVQDPEVRLLNNGAEETKGNKVSQEAFRLMREQKVYRFGGNIEAREVPFGRCDVVACDGFDGNIVIKLTEGLASALFGIMKTELVSDTRSKLGALLVKPALSKVKGRLDSEQHGGAPLLGVNGAMVKAHGSSQARGICNAVRQAAQMVRGDMVERIRAGLAELGLKEQ